MIRQYGTLTLSDESLYRGYLKDFQPCGRNQHPSYTVKHPFEATERRASMVSLD